VRAALLAIGLLVAAGCASLPPWVDGPAESALARAHAHARRGDYQLAVRAYDDFLARYPDDPAAPRVVDTRDTLASILAFRGELERVRDEVARLREELTLRETDLGRRESDLQRVRRELALRQQDLTARQVEAERLRAETERLRTETERLRSETDRLRVETERLRTDIERLKQVDLELERRRK
jgi:DNA repair exonuclease SbcCD ATPase subunit